MTHIWLDGDKIRADHLKHMFVNGEDEGRCCGGVDQPQEISSPLSMEMTSVKRT